MDSWQPDAGLSPRHAEARRKGQIEREVILQRSQREGEKARACGSRWGWVGTEEHLMQSAMRDASRLCAAESLFLKSLVPALLILAPWELRKISLRGLLSPRNLPKGLS